MRSGVIRIDLKVQRTLTRYTSNPAQMTSVMLGPELIFASTYALPENRISERHRKKRNITSCIASPFTFRT
jgi:hypothetical protein